MHDKPKNEPIILVGRDERLVWFPVLCPVSEKTRRLGLFGKDGGYVPWNGRLSFAKAFGRIASHYQPGHSYYYR